MTEGACQGHLGTVGYLCRPGPECQVEQAFEMLVSGLRMSALQFTIDGVSRLNKEWHHGQSFPNIHFQHCQSAFVKVKLDVLLRNRLSQQAALL